MLRLRLLARRIKPLPLPARAYSFTAGPSPPKLPASEQAEFERLQRQAAQPTLTRAPPAPEKAQEQEDEAAVNPGLYRGAPPEFHGDKNPKTGEIGGPKKEPLRWGGQGDWSYNGRVTDF
ncbi:DUF1674 domain-containing protein [Moelleriella libera RCEF 2490]|uniref:Succinate dehydrogenase assembly factor 4, mitochondrial n=1 Tax=Moelleriella libera RCEF 2490 TaxID=1081109 RepID=A0A167VS29_9HYPO|nr:DUF1674 domain-containing protein [Moelleriella libera RCEF 2490]